MITEDQYALLFSIKDEPIELSYPLPKEWEQVKQYLYVVKTFDMMCTTGTKAIPWIWAINVHGLDELALYEKSCEKRSKKRSQKRADKHKKISKTAARIIEGVVIAFIAAVVSKIFGFL